MVNVATEVDDLPDSASSSRSQIYREIVAARLLVCDGDPALVEIVVCDRVLWIELVEFGSLAPTGSLEEGVIRSDALTSGEPKLTKQKLTTRF